MIFIIEKGKLEGFVLSLIFKEVFKENYFNLYRIFYLKENILNIDMLEFSYDYFLLYFNNGLIDKIEYNFD